MRYSVSQTRNTMFTTITTEMSKNEIIEHLLEKVHEFDNQQFYNIEYKLFLLLNDRMCISALLKTRTIPADFQDAENFFKHLLDFYDNNIYLFCQDFISAYDKALKNKRKE